MLNTPVGGEKNFPPTPSWFPKPCRPCFYQDINREIPQEFQKWVRLLFYLWMCKLLLTDCKFEIVNNKNFIILL